MILKKDDYTKIIEQLIVVEDRESRHKAVQFINDIMANLRDGEGIDIGENGIEYFVDDKLSINVIPNINSFNIGINIKF